MYHAVIGIQLDSNNYSSAIPILRDAVKKYPEDIEVRTIVYLQLYSLNNVLQQPVNYKLTSTG